MSDENTLNEELLDAARYGRYPDLKEALAKGADLNAQDKDGNTALTFACANSNFKCARLLMKSGASLLHEEDTAIRKAAWLMYRPIKEQFNKRQNQAKAKRKQQKDFKKLQRKANRPITLKRR